MHPLGWAIIAGVGACASVCLGNWLAAAGFVGWFGAECQRIRTW